MIETILANATALGGNRMGAAQNIRRMIRQKRLRNVGAGIHLTEYLTEPDRRPVRGSAPVATASGEHTASGERTASGEHWLGRAYRALAGGDYHLAVYAAGMARQHCKTAQTSMVLARADAVLERFEDAVIEAHRAVRLAPDEPEHQLTLAGIFEDLGNWDAALRCYHAAKRLDPGSDAPRLGEALVLIQTGDTGRAQRILEAVYARSADKRTVGDYLSLVMVEAAERVPMVRDGETYVITSPREVAAMRTRLARAAKLTQDPDLRSCIAEVREYVETCAKRTWLGHRMFRSRTGWLNLALLALIGCAIVVALTVDRPPILLLAAALLAAGRIALGLLRYAWVPRWKLNHWAHERELDDQSIPLDQVDPVRIRR